MNSVIEQTVTFKNTTPEELFDIFLDSNKHSQILGGAVVKISKNEGDGFTCLNGNLTGKNLMIVPNRMIVQSWRGNIWTKEDLDSILILTFTPITDGAQIYLVHSNTPDQFTELWDKVYWQPLKEYLEKKK